MVEMFLFYGCGLTLVILLIDMIIQGKKTTNIVTSKLYYKKSNTAYFIK